MTYRAAGMFIALGFVGVMPASAQPTGKPAATPKVAAAVPVPRTDFIRTMDLEFGKMDADKNKIVTRAEIEQSQRTAGLLRARESARALFIRLDTDKNGQLNMTEFEQMAAAPPRPNPAPILAEVDLNRDGQITLVEYRTAKLNNFDRMDADKDGVVSIVEMKAAGLIK